MMRTDVAEMRPFSYAVKRDWASVQSAIARVYPRKPARLS